MAAILLAVLVACAQAPETGRSQFIMPTFSEGNDPALGAGAFNEIRDEKKVSNDPGMTAAVNRVGERIAAVSPKPDWDWEFVLFDDDSPNAFALPGGKVGVHTGLFKVVKTDDQLAAVMGHEVAHAIARHGVERMSTQMATQGGLIVGGLLLGADAPTLVLTGMLANVALTLPHSRVQESEADEIGLYYMARAGYDPRAAVELWQNMAALADGNQPPQFMSTHPSHGNRIARLEQLMPKALQEYRTAEATTGPGPVGRLLAWLEG